MASKSFGNPVAGPLELDWQALHVNAHPDQTLVLYAPPPSPPPSVRPRVWRAVLLGAYPARREEMMLSCRREGDR
ncbi:hypothetical protein ACWDA3_60405 [Nonomuraea rubra]